MATGAVTVVVEVTILTRELVLDANVSAFLLCLLIENIVKSFQHSQHRRWGRVRSFETRQGSRLGIGCYLSDNSGDCRCWLCICLWNCRSMDCQRQEKGSDGLDMHCFKISRKITALIVGLICVDENFDFLQAIGAVEVFL